MLTVISNLTLQLADDDLRRTVKQIIVGTVLPNANTTEQNISLGALGSQTASQVILGLSNSVLTVLAPSNPNSPINAVVTIGSATLTFNNLTSPLVLPCAVTSIQLTNSGSSPVEAYLFQGG